jgi:lysozyme
MSENINPMVVDLSHWDPAKDYNAVKNDGIVGVIYKATQGTNYTDPTYVNQQHAAKAAGLRWGAYHFAEATDVDAQVKNFMKFASPDPDELFCLDWEDYGSNTMSADQAKQWITQVETALGRPGQCVIYSGNTAKELIDGSDAFFGSRRLWLAQYSTTPQPQQSWAAYWLWQFTDGQVGPTPHTVDGVGPCDINSYAGSPDQLRAEWASGPLPAEPRVAQQPQPRLSPQMQSSGKGLVAVDIAASDGVRVNVSINGLPYGRRSRHAD